MVAVAKKGPSAGSREEGRTGLLPDDRRGSLAQDELLDLARGGFGELVDERHAVRGLEVGKPVAGVVDELFFRRGRARLQDHECEGRLSPLLVRQADDRDLLDRRVPQQYTIDLDR